MGAVKMMRLLRCQSLFVLATLLSQAMFLERVEATSYQSVSDIRASMYVDMQYSGGWYKLLNATSETGSQAPVAGQTVTGVLMNASHVQWPLAAPRILVCNLTNFESVMLRLVADAASSSNVVGVLVDPNGPLPDQFSSAEMFPGASNAPYADKSYAWNPAGTGLSRQHFNFPVIFMNAVTAAVVASRTTHNNDRAFRGALYVADMKMNMLAIHNSSYCLTHVGTACKAIGGFSVWSAMPPMAPLLPGLPLDQIITGNGALVAASPKPITIITAQIDSNSYFHDYTQASDTSLSGLIAMLAAMDILRATGAAATYTRQLVFMALAGEPWDFMGSRRLMWEMYYNSTATDGLTNLTQVDQVIELQGVGRGYSQGSNSSTLYLHTQRSGGFGDASHLVATMMQAAVQTTQQAVYLSQASALNPGIPPSSLMSFLRHKPSIQGVVIADFDQAIGKYYQSELDTGDFVDIQPMVAAALVLARSLHTLASQNGVTIELQVDMASITDLVTRLAYCLMLDGPAPDYSLLCSTVQSFITVGFTDQNANGVVQPFPWRYIGIAMPDTDNPTNVTYKREIFSFLFNLMANTTASEHTSTVCDPFVNICPAGQVCVGWRYGQDVTTSNATMGLCKNTTARFVQATSTRIYFPNTSVQLLLVEPTEFEGNFSWPADPLWTESDWTSDSPYVKVYMNEPRSVQVAVLISGLLLTVATGLAAHFVQKFFEKHLKSE